MEGKITGVLYAVFRVDGKHKTLSSIKGFQKHMEREQETLNADSNKTYNNRILIGNSNIYKLMKDNISDCKLRKNGNIATELLLTASKQYFDNISPEQKEMWIDENIKFINKHFNESCIYAVLHEDETTPHIHALISQRAKDRWGNTVINNSIHFGGTKEIMREWQDKYSESMSQFNLSRGIRFSKAHHVKIRQFYALINDNMSIEKLNSLLNDVYRYSYIKEEYDMIGKQIEAYRTISNTEDISKLKKELYKLSTISTAPEKFFKKEQEQEQQQTVKNMMRELNIDIDIDYLVRETQQRRKETNVEATARIIRETQLKREVLEFKKIIKNMGTDMDIEKGKAKEYQKQINRFKEDTELYKMVIRTVSEYYHIPQQAIESIVRSISKNMENTTERQIKKEV